METEEIDKRFKDPSPWHPIQDSVDLKHLGKLMEELGECQSAVARCLIQGMYEKEPVTGKINIEWLQDEIADVLANIQLVCDRFKLDDIKILERVQKKKRHLKAWHMMA